MWRGLSFVYQEKRRMSNYGWPEFELLISQTLALARANLRHVTVQCLCVHQRGTQTEMNMNICTQGFISPCEDEVYFVSHFLPCPSGLRKGVQWITIASETNLQGFFSDGLLSGTDWEFNLSQTDRPLSVRPFNQSLLRWSLPSLFDSWRVNRFTSSVPQSPSNSSWQFSANYGHEYQLQADG